MELLVKIGLVVGIAIGIMLLILLGLTVLPQVISNNFPTMVAVAPSGTINAEEVRLQFNQTEAYTIFVGRFPEHREDFQSYPQGANLVLQAINTKSNNLIELSFDYNVQEGRIHMNIRCDMGNVNDNGGTYANEGAVPNFLKSTNCLD